MTDLVEWLTVCIAEDERKSANFVLSTTMIAGHYGNRLERDAARNRRVLKRHTPVWDVSYWMCPACNWADDWTCPDLRDLASVYADRPGYRAEWGPTSE